MANQQAYLWARETAEVAPIRILLFEDNPVTARVICEMTREQERCVVEQVGSLSQGLDRLHAGGIDLILLDLGLPDSEGEETLVSVHERAPELPIIVITAQKPDELALRAVELGAQDYLLKSEISSLSLARSIHYAVTRHRAERALRQSEHRFRTLIENSYDGIVLIDALGQATYASPSTERIFGYKAEEYISRDISSMIHPDDLLRVAKAFRWITATPGTVGSLEYRHQHKNGTWRWIEGVGVNFINEPSINAIVTNYRDVTNRKLAEQALRQAYDELERRVEERTAELSAANTSLTREIAERQRAGRVLRERNRELAALNTITAAISRSLDLEVVLETLRRLLLEEVEVDAGCVYLYQSDEDVLLLRLSWGLSDETLASCGRLPAHNSPGNDSEAGLRLQADDAMKPPITEPGWNWLRVQLPFQGEPRGVLDLYRRAPAGFGVEEARFFNILGQQIGGVFGNAQFFDEVRGSREQLQRLSRRLVEVQERERRDIARELHDEVGQLLTGLKMNLELAQRSTPEVMAERIDESLAQVNRLLNEVRNLSLDLRPAMLDDFGLLPALLWLFERYQSQTQVRVDFKHSGAFGRQAPELETALYRIVQEALTNVARYAGVKEVEVRLWGTPTMIGVKIEDAGAGFDPQVVWRAGASNGLAGMRERTAFLGGLLSIESYIDGGTCITAEFPLAGWKTAAL